MGDPLPMTQWLIIVRYAGFHDIPRRMLALDRDLLFWVFDCPFDEKIDDYRDTFQVFSVGTDSVMAHNRYTTISLAESEVASSIRTEQIEFDDTRRSKMFLHNGLAYPTK